MIRFHLECKSGASWPLLQTIYIRRKRKWLAIGGLCKECGVIVLLPEFHHEGASVTHFPRTMKDALRVGGYRRACLNKQMMI